MEMTVSSSVSVASNSDQVGKKEMVMRRPLVGSWDDDQRLLIVARHPE